MFDNIINVYTVVGGLIAFLGMFALILAFKWREVVPTNYVHIVQRAKSTTSYGTGLDAGTVYYAVPSYIPAFGITRTILPVNNFTMSLKGYEGYDKDRVPFALDITAFFRINDTTKASTRVKDFEELKHQLEAVTKGAARNILATFDINEIMTDRSKFGHEFTVRVKEELANWGVEPVKNMELMDIRDSEGSKIIQNIQAKKSSHIEMESRIEVANNQQKAKTAEIEAERVTNLAAIDAKKTTEVAAIEAKEIIGTRNAEQDRVVGIKKEKATQEIKEEAAATMRKEMEIKSVETQRAAEIEKAAAVTKAEQDALTMIKREEGKLKQTDLEAQGVKIAAEGNLKQTLLAAEGLQKTGEAKAAAEKALQLAPVEAQITLAKEIGENHNYQSYLITLRRVEADQAIGIAQAAALQQADIKVIANTGSASEGLSSLNGLLSSKGGQQVGAFVEGLAQTPVGARVVETLAGSQKNGTVQ